MNRDNTIITFIALVAEQSDQDQILESLVGKINARPSKEVQMSLNPEEIDHYYACPEFKGLTRLVTTDGKEFIVNERWEMFDWRYKQETGQIIKCWQDYHSYDIDTTIRTYFN